MTAITHLTFNVETWRMFRMERAWMHHLEYGTSEEVLQDEMDEIIKQCNNMDFKERLTIENKELNEKIEKLEAFLNSDKLKEVEPMQISLLFIQLDTMNAYARVLNLRISLL